MLKLALAATLFPALLAPLASARAETYTVENWPADIDTIPCSAWQRYDDGTWVLKGSVKVGASVIDNVGVKGDAAAQQARKAVREIAAGARIARAEDACSAPVAL